MASLTVFSRQRSTPMKSAPNHLSRVSSLPVLRRFSPPAVPSADAKTLAGYLKSQRLAFAAVREVTSLMREGWTEKQAADLVTTYLRDCGVKDFFHYPFAWYGERTRFDKIRTYSQYSPSKRLLLPGEVFILDVAPILDGYICDIGYTSSLGPNPELDKAMTFLDKLRNEIPKLFSSSTTGSQIWSDIDDTIKKSGYDNIHQKYPFSVLGHRIHHNVLHGPSFRLLNFGWQSYWEFLSRGLFGQLLNANHEGDLSGLWAIEPHIGTSTFGAKFEEILVVDKKKAHWLEEMKEKSDV